MGKIFVSPRVSSFVHVAVNVHVCANVHADGLVWLDKGGGSVTFELCYGDSEGFSLAPPSLTGRSRVATGTKYAIPMHWFC